MQIKKKKASDTPNVDHEQPLTWARIESEQPK